MAYPELNLTPEEIAEGWRFCCEFDGLLIGKVDAEMEFCTCASPTTRERSKEE